jgi:hypothetical protein
VSIHALDIELLQNEKMPTDVEFNVHPVAIDLTLWTWLLHGMVVAAAVFNPP